MPRFHGTIGFEISYEDAPGVWKNQIIERPANGDVLKHARNWEQGEGKNDDLNVRNQISILANDYTFQHCSAIRYVRWMGADWKVTGMDVEYPRIVLTLGGVYNGNKTAIAPSSV